jgi:hypothetical protein
MREGLSNDALSHSGNRCTRIVPERIKMPPCVLKRECPCIPRDLVRDAGHSPISNKQQHELEVRDEYGYRCNIGPLPRFGDCGY